MESQNVFAQWQGFKPYNQVMYGERIALITGTNKSGAYPISVIDNNRVECYDVKGSDLKAISLQEAGQLLRNCSPTKSNPFECAFANKTETSKITITFYNNYCVVIENDKEILKGVISEFHTLQNIISEYLGYYIYLPIKINK